MNNETTELRIQLNTADEYIIKLKRNHALEVAFLKTTIQNLQRGQTQRNNNIGRSIKYWCDDCN